MNFKTLFVAIGTIALSLSFTSCEKEEMGKGTTLGDNGLSNAVAAQTASLNVQDSLDVVEGEDPMFNE